MKNQFTVSEIFMFLFDNAQLEVVMGRKTYTREEAMQMFFNMDNQDAILNVKQYSNYIHVSLDKWPIKTPNHNEVVKITFKSFGEVETRTVVFSELWDGFLVPKTPTDVDVTNYKGPCYQINPDEVISWVKK